MSVALALLAMLIELALGYPHQLLRVIGHPVTWIGWLIGVLDRFLNRDADGAVWRRIAGIITVLVVSAIVGSIAYLLQHALFRLPFGIFAVALLASTLLAQRSLYRYVADVATALETGGVEAGRAAVSHIVGRDAAALDASGVARAAIESLAENFSDAIVAPVVWMTVAGLPGAAIYKAINTADSMIGHRTARYAKLRLGRRPARRSRQSAGVAARGAFSHRRGGDKLELRRRRGVERRVARRLAPPLAQCRLSGSRHGGRAWSFACRPAHL